MKNDEGGLPFVLMVKYYFCLDSFVMIFLQTV